MHALAITAPDTAPIMAAVTMTPTNPIVVNCIKGIAKKTPNSAMLAQDSIPIAAHATMRNVFALSLAIGLFD